MNIDFDKHGLISCIMTTVILLVVLYGCETWPLTLMEEHKLRAFENRVLRRILDEEG
jgi:hypothetical protein